MLVWITLSELHGRFGESNRKQMQRRETEKCRGWDLNPRTPKGRDVL